MDLQYKILYNCIQECGWIHDILNRYHRFQHRDQHIGYEHSSFRESSLYSEHIRVCTNCKDPQRNWWDKRNYKHCFARYKGHLFHKVTICKDVMVPQRLVQLKTKFNGFFN